MDQMLVTLVKKSQVKYIINKPDSNKDLFIWFILQIHLKKVTM